METKNQSTEQPAAERPIFFEGDLYTKSELEELLATRKRSRRNANRSFRPVIYGLGFRADKLRPKRKKVLAK
jgi:hypothetical protein